MPPPPPVVQAPPASIRLPLLMLTQSPVVNVPLVVAKTVVVPDLVPLVGGLPAPPPRTGTPPVNAPLELSTDVELK